MNDGYKPNQNTQRSPPAIPRLVQYLDLSSQHLFFGGRRFIHVFSRETGKCVCPGSAEFAVVLGGGKRLC